MGKTNSKSLIPSFLERIIKDSRGKSDNQLFVEAQEAVNEEISLIRKRDREAEIHNLKKYVFYIGTNLVISY